jgi:hypothetical protein
MPDPGSTQVEYSHAVQVKEALQVPFPLAPTLTWDAYWRSVYNRLNLALDRQARVLLERGNLTTGEMKNYVEVQRNGLAKELRKPLTPFGRMYSELKKPAGKMPTVEQLLAKKGSFEAVLKSVGKTNVGVNRIAALSKAAGPVMITMEFTMTVVIIKLAPPGQKEREAARLGTGTGGAATGGALGMWGGCATLAAMASPSLVVPVIGEITEATACFVGGILGGFGIGALGRSFGEHLGTATYDSAAEWEWK